MNCLTLKCSSTYCSILLHQKTHPLAWPRLFDFCREQTIAIFRAQRNHEPHNANANVLGQSPDSFLDGLLPDIEHNPGTLRGD